MEIDTPGTPPPWPLNHKRSHSIVSDTASTASDSSVEDRPSYASWAHRRKRQARYSPTPSDDDVHTLRAGVWVGERASAIRDSPGAPPASPDPEGTGGWDGMMEEPAQPTLPLATAPQQFLKRGVASQFQPPTPSPLALSRLSMEDDVSAPPAPIHPDSGLGPPLPASNLGKMRSSVPHLSDEEAPTDPGTSARRYSPGVHTELPTGGRPLLRYTMGYREDCELCRNRTPGHYSHVVRQDTM